MDSPVTTIIYYTDLGLVAILNVTYIVSVPSCSEGV